MIWPCRCVTLDAITARHNGAIDYLPLSLFATLAHIAAAMMPYAMMLPAPLPMMPRCAHTTAVCAATRYAAATPCAHKICCYHTLPPPPPPTPPRHASSLLRSYHTAARLMPPPFVCHYAILHIRCRPPPRRRFSLRFATISPLPSSLRHAIIAFRLRLISRCRRCHAMPLPGCGYRRDVIYAR